MKRLILSSVLLLLAAGRGWAQAPSISGIFPPGGRAGTTIDCTISGAALADAQSVLVSGAGVKVERRDAPTKDSFPARIVIEPGAEVGAREVRLVTNHGATNAGHLWVGRYPDLLEKEPNDGLATAQPLAGLPATVSGRSDRAEDVDYYSFTAAAGETWAFSLNAAEHRSSLDGYLVLLDARGHTLQSAMDNFDRDPRLIYTFKNAGRYVLRVRDSLFRGGPAFTYRLTVGKTPVVTRYGPLGGKRGTTVSLALRGVNLGGTSTLQVALPADGQRDSVQIVPKTALGDANPIPVYLDDSANVLEREPDDDLKTAVAAGTLPATISGWIDKPGDRDVYSFSAVAKQPVVVEVLSRRLGARLDSLLRVLDATGKELAQNDDAVGKDSRLTFTAPADGTYYAEVSNLTGRSGDEYFYRLKLGGGPQSDFELSVTPDNPVVPVGAAVAVTVTARRDGFAGEIPLRIENLPAGVTASPAVIHAGQNSAVFTLSAPAGTAPATTRLRVVGAAKVGERMLERVAGGQETYQPPLTNQPAQMRSRDTEMVLAGVGPAPAYTLAVTAPAAEIKAGQKLELTVKVARAAPFKDPVVVTVLGLPGKITASALTLNANQTEGKITLTAPAALEPGPAALVILGTAKTVVVAAPAFPVSVQPAK